jgi:hypothetical protein
MVGVYTVTGRGYIMPLAVVDLAIPIPGSETHAWAAIGDQAYLGEILSSSGSPKDKI